MTRKILGAVAGIAALSGCEQGEQPADTAQIEAQLKEVETKWNHAYAKRDAAGLAAMYADDAALASPDADLIEGKGALARAMQGYASDPNLRIEFRSDRTQVAASGDLAYTRGRYTMTMTDPKTKGPFTTKGNYLTVWRKQADGSWKAVEDFATTGAPPTVATRAQALPG
jgi:uncharacterized protein (TIGR02246 family)